MALNVADRESNRGGVDKVRGQELVWDWANGCCKRDGAIAKILSELGGNFTPTENHKKMALTFQFTPDLL